MSRTLQLPVGFELVTQEQHHIVSRMRQDVKSQNAELPSRKHTAYLLHSYSVYYIRRKHRLLMIQDDTKPRPLLFGMERRHAPVKTGKPRAWLQPPISPQCMTIFNKEPRAGVLSLNLFPSFFYPEKKRRKSCKLQLLPNHTRPSSHKTSLAPFIHSCPSAPNPRRHISSHSREVQRRKKRWNAWWSHDQTHAALKLI